MYTDRETFAQMVSRPELPALVPPTGLRGHLRVQTSRGWACSFSRARAKSRTSSRTFRPFRANFGKALADLRPQLPEARGSPARQTWRRVRRAGHRGLTLKDLRAGRE